MKLFDALELVFGPDPGLLRLRAAIRAVSATALALTSLLLLNGAGSPGAIAAAALGFMTANVSSVAVSDKGRGPQALTLGLMAIPALGASLLASWLSNWPLAGEIGFVAVVAAASLARLMGPRGVSLGVVAFICYFAGEILHAKPSDAPLMAEGVAIGLGASALMRFLILPDDPRATIRRLNWHLRRRVARIVSESGRALANADRPSEQRIHNELVRLSDALQAAGEQLGGLEKTEEADLWRRRLLAVDLAAERLLRAASGGRAENVSDNAARLGALGRDLRQGRLPPARPGLRPVDAPHRYRRAPVGAALDALESALADLESAP
jgi:hypothetical protein